MNYVYVIELCLCNRIDIKVILGTGGMGKQKGSSWQERKYWKKLLELGAF